MAGSIYYGYDNTSTPSKEYNVATDIPAAQIMFSSEWLYFGLAPIDCTNFMQFNGLIWQQFLNYVISSSAVRSILTSYAVWYANGGKNIDAMEPFSPGTGTSTMHDVLAAFLAGAYTDVSPTISEILPLVITRDGYTQVNASHGKGVNSCLKFETSNPYLSTTVVGSIVLESIIKPTNKS
ncbi:unnamed protein product [Didymodactylos carnosus]|nr:unnamed protein product [Didymodactylos carnosus]CAF4196164.1 unnamed protein product [Didymodactylos carnosus]